MTKALALLTAVVLAGTAVATEEESIQLKVYVDGMSCPTGCAPKVAKGLAAVKGATNVKMEDFDKGLFTLSFDGKAKLEPKDFEKSLGEYKVKKMVATVTGTIALKDKELVLTTGSGQKYGLNLASCCSEEKGEAKKDAGKKDDCETCPEALKAKVEAFVKEGKNVKVTGVVGSCCEVSLTIAAIDEVKKATN
jgi:hypothetical protein